jgi:ParB family transcriptional regulator, chromosome partitioning protein
VTAEKYLTYRGDIKGAVGAGRMVAFVGMHAEGQPTALYRLDADKLTLDADPLPKGGTAIVVVGEALFIAGGDGAICRATIASGEPKPLASAFDTPAIALAPLVDGRLAALVASRVVILSTGDGKPVQSLDLPEPGACLAADPTGRWLAVGTAKGTVLVFDCENKPEFLLSDSGRLHEGAVTAMLFEPDELRFLSAGADHKLYSTHARGKLEPEDKGRANNHTDLVTALIWGPGDRLYSGSRDGSIKSWPRVGAVKPATIKDGVGRVVALAMVHVHDRPRLVAACDDNTIRVFPVDAAGKIGDTSHRVYDAYARARHELSQDDPTRREEALKALAGYADIVALALVAQQAEADADHALRRLSAELLGASPHARAATLLEKLLAHRDEAVRVSAFHGLRKHLGESDLRPINLALNAEKPDVGCLAVQALEALAPRNEQAMARLMSAINSKTAEVRLAAVLSLESAHDARSPESNLAALISTHADVRRAALVRLYRRGLLDEPAVQSALRRRAEDADPEVRRTAFLLSLHTRDRLLQVLRSRDPELQRQLVELESTVSIDPATSAGRGSPNPAQSAGRGSPDPAPPTTEGLPGTSEKKKAKPAKAAATALIAELSLDDADFEPLLQATASRSLDTSLRGARGLAVLGDPRAFGLLLQLSREEDKAARAEVCRALAALADPRAAERLRSMLHDAEPEVRDAAFTAMARLYRAEPLAAAESGLNASHEDVRRRGLQALVEQLRKTKAGGAAGPALALLARVLNDSLPSIRTEAFKSALALGVGGAGAGTLRFASRSVHADVRREVLTEAMAQLGEPWGWDLLLEFFNDPDPALRGESFTFALKKTKGLEFLEAALASRYPDLRKRSVDELVKKHTAGAQAMLVRAIDDEDRTVRLAAIESLVAADALPVLAEAIANAHPDVRLRAAKALARHGDARALEPLLAMATAPAPEETERRDDWANLVESALDGLVELGDPSALTHLIPLLDSKRPPIRLQAARALVWASRPGSTDALREALQHADPAVKYHAAKGLAYTGDASVAPLVFSEAGGKILSVDEQIAAALAIGATGEDRLAVYLDDTRDEVRLRALILLMMLEWKDPDGTAVRCLACLASRTPRIRLTAARAVETLAEAASQESFVAGLLNDRGDKPEWKIAGPTVDAFAELLVHGAPQLRARTARLFASLNDKEQDAFDQAWAVHEARYASELAQLRRQAEARKPVPPRYTPEQLRELAFGAYVGLVREHRGTVTKGQSAAAADASAVRVRQTALGRLLKMAGSDPHLAAAARPVFVQALGDPNQAVRFQAFEHARAVGMGASDLADEALASGHIDLGIKGLELLSGGGSEAEGEAVLERAMLSRTDRLAVDAAELLIKRRAPVAVASRALEAAFEALRILAVNWLIAGYDEDPAARDALRGAMGSRYEAIREAAAFGLATKKDASAFATLVAILAAAFAPVKQRRFIQVMEALGDPRTADAFLDRIENDPAGTALADDLLKAVGRFRRPESAGRLLVLWEKDAKRREAIFNALLVISGYDQRIEDPEDERPDDRWQEKQFPRHDDVLARLIDRVSAPADARSLARLIPGARWARGKSVDPVLARLINHPNDEVRQKVVEAIAWRLRKRGGDAEPLRKLVAQPGHSAEQFFAAEGLARAGRGDGLNMLLASIDFAKDLDIRRRAVVALGELADDRALDVLLKLAGEDGHALQEQALEAIGHLNRSPRLDEVFKVLERYAKGETKVAYCALNGLRWLDTRASWQIIRQRAADKASLIRMGVVELLGYNDDPATRDLLLRILAGDQPNVIRGALSAARRVLGPESIEPDYAVLQNDFVVRMVEYRAILGRVLERGEPRRILEILPKCADLVRDALAAVLLSRPEPPVAEALAVLDSPDPTTAGVAARILGRAGAKAAGAGSSVAKALAKWRKVWEADRPEFDRKVAGKAQLFDRLTACVRAMVWAAGRLDVATEALAEAASARPDDAEYRQIRLAAVLALASGEPSPIITAALESAALVGAPEVRSAAAQAIARRDPKQAAGLADRLLSDRDGFYRLTLDGRVNVEETLRSAASQVHYQGVVLAGLIDRGEVETLAGVAEDRSLPEAARLGAVEGLAAMAHEPAEDVLRRVGLRADEDEEFRKAAWRGLRRSKRARQKAEVRS